MKVNFLILIFFIFNTSNILLATNYDGCKIKNQDCTCSNTGKKGKCNEGPHHNKGDLYCRCDDVAVAKPTKTAVAKPSISTPVVTRSGAGGAVGGGWTSIKDQNGIDIVSTDGSRVCNSDQNCCSSCGYSCDFSKPQTINGTKYSGVCNRPWLR